MDSGLVIHKSSRPRLFHPPLPSILSIYVPHFQMTESKSFNAVIQTPVVQTLDSAIHRKNHYPTDKY